MIISTLIAAATLLAWGPPGAPDKPWREIRYTGRTSYTIVAMGDGPVLRAESEGDNSALVRNQRLDPAGVRLHWRWRVLEHPHNADPEQRKLDDRAAGVIVIVRRSFFPWRTRALIYQWCPSRPQGEWSRSPYSKNVRTLVLRSAPADSTWREETRDLAADLATAFGVLPDRIEAIGVICDTDNTGSTASAEFGEIRIERPGGAMAR